jgi:DNA-binding transcriptional LysR family regulator
MTRFSSGLSSPEDLLCFLAVVDHGGFTRAAQRLGITQPAVSQSVRRLEDLLGAVLLERSARQVKLTTAGQAVVRDARVIVALLGQLPEAASGGRDGRAVVRIGAATSVVSGLIPAFLKHDQSYSYQVHAMSQDEQRAAMHNGTIDVGIGRTWNEPDFCHTLLFKEPLFALLPEGHALAHEPRVKLSDLAQERFVLFERDAAPVAFDAIMSACQRAGFSPRIGQDERSEQVMSGIVAGGLGVSIIPRMASAVLTAGVVALPLTDRQAVTPLAVIAPPTDPRHLARHVAAQLREVLTLQGLAP